MDLNDVFTLLTQTPVSALEEYEPETDNDGVASFSLSQIMAFDTTSSTTTTPSSLLHTLSELSDEQRAIVQAVIDKHENVFVLAKAGSGKTTLLVNILLQYLQSNADNDAAVLMLMYNKRIKEETRYKCQASIRSGRVFVESLHSAAKNLFSWAPGTYSQTDRCIVEALKKKPKSTLSNIKLVIVDEAQDLNALYYRFLCHLLTHTSNGAIAERQMVMVGDVFQTIATYNGADWAYLADPQHYFGRYVPSPFYQYSLTISWRISHEMAHFINEYNHPKHLIHIAPREWWKTHGEHLIALWGDGIRANPRRGVEPKSLYLIPNGALYKTFMRDKPNVKRFGKVLQRGMKEFGTDICILARSIRQNDTVRNIIDEFGQDNKANWILIDKDNRMRQEARVKKRVGSTIHAQKGCEFAFTANVSFDSFLENKAMQGDTNADPMKLLCVQYVANTRAKQRHIVTWGGVPFVTYRQDALDIIEHSKRAVLDVTDAFVHVPYDDVLDQEALQVKPLTLPTTLPTVTLAKLPSTSHPFLLPGRSPGVLEDVSAILGQAVEYAMVCHMFGQHPVIFVRETRMDADMRQWILAQQAANYKHHDATTLCRLAIASRYQRNGYPHTWRQLKHVDWRHYDTFIQKCAKNALYMLYAIAFPDNASSLASLTLTAICKALKPVTQYQVPCAMLWPYPWFSQAIKQQRLAGLLDFVLHQRVVVELKLTQRFESDHAQQVQLYHSMRSVQYETGVKDAPLQKPDVTSYVILPHLAQVHCVQLTQSLRPFSYLYRMLQRKLSMRPYATADTIQRDLTEYAQRCRAVEQQERALVLRYQKKRRQDNNAASPYAKRQKLW